MRDIFICYSSIDETAAKEVCRYLERHALTCWISCRDNEIGDNYLSNINTAIRSSKIFVILVSKNSIASTQVANELAIANSETKNGMKRFPILLDSDLQPDQLDGALGYALTGIHMCNWNSFQEQKRLVRQIGAELHLEMNPSTGRFTRNNSEFYDGYQPMPEEAVYESMRSDDSHDNNVSDDIYENITSSDIYDDLLKDDESPVFVSEEVFPIYPSSKKITHSQISIAALLLLFFLGTTFVLCGCAESFAYLYEDFAVVPTAMDYLSSQIRSLFVGSILFFICWQLPTIHLKKAAPYLAAVFVITTLLVSEYHPWISLNSFHFIPENFGPWCLIILFAWIMSNSSLANPLSRLQLGLDECASCIFFASAVYFGLSIKKLGFFVAVLALVLAFGITFVFAKEKKHHYRIAISITIACLVFIVAVFNGTAESWGLVEVTAAYFRQRLTPPEIITQVIQSTSFAGGGELLGDIFKADLLPLTDNFFVTLFHMGWSVAITIVLIYSFLLYHIYRIAKACLDTHDYFESTICFGVLIHIGFCAAYHICMNLNLLPIIGCPLPFISNWGNEFLFAEIGCVFAAAKQVTKNQKTVVSVED